METIVLSGVQGLGRHCLRLSRLWGSGTAAVATCPALSVATAGHLSISG